MGEYFVHSEQMTVGYDGKPLIRDIEIRLNRGEILTLIGPNGAGKSTILKSLTRQLKLVGGTVYLDQKLMSQMSGKEVAQKLAVVTTERIRPELMTCEDIVATGRYPYTGTLGILSEGDWEKVHKAMEMVHALDFKDRDFTEISDGQRQRILLARAICQEPEVIVLDEPTSFLDIRHKLELLSILKKMVLEHHTAVLMSLHELDLAQKISDYVIWQEGFLTRSLVFMETGWIVLAHRRRFLHPNISIIFMELQREAIMLLLDVWKWALRQVNHRYLSLVEMAEEFRYIENCRERVFHLLQV